MLVRRSIALVGCGVQYTSIVRGGFRPCFSLLVVGLGFALVLGFEGSGENQAARSSFALCFIRLMRPIYARDSFWRIRFGGVPRAFWVLEVSMGGARGYTLILFRTTLAFGLNFKSLS